MADDFLKQLDQLAKEKAEREQAAAAEQSRRSDAESKKKVEQLASDDSLRATLAGVVDTYIRKPLTELKSRFGGEVQDAKQGGNGQPICHTIIWRVGNQLVQDTAVEVEVQKAFITFTHNGKPGPSVTVRLAARRDGQTVLDATQTEEIENPERLKPWVEKWLVDAARHVLNG